MTTVRVRLEVDLGSDEVAERLRAALDVDTEDYAELTVAGDRLEAVAEGPPGTVWNTVDDLLACLSVAMGVEELDEDEPEDVVWE